MSEAIAPPAPESPAIVVESPPATELPARDEAIDPRARLHQLAAELVRSHNRRLIIEYLQLRRAMR